MSFDELPAETLAIIFENYIRSEGHLQFLKNVIQVCKTWHEVRLLPSLCKIVDIAGVKNKNPKYLPEQELANMNWDLPVTTDLSITHVWLTPEVSEALFSGCPNLKSLSLSDCRVHASTFGIVILHCKKLESIAVDSVTQNGYIINRSALEPIFYRGGRNLKSVSMLNQMFRDELECGDLVAVILEQCPHLEQLKLSADPYNWRWPRFPEEKLRTCCPKLRVISVDSFVVYSDSYTTLKTGGFRNLEELELLALLHLGGFLNVLRNAEQLKRLTMKNVCVYGNDNPTNIHKDIGAKHLEKLHLVNTAFGEGGLQQLLWRWRHSLRELTLEDRSRFLSAQVLLALVRGNEEPSCKTLANQEVEPSLEVLNLAVPITNASVLVQVVRECKRLRALDTSECMNLPEAYRWKFDTIGEINALRDSL